MERVPCEYYFVVTLFEPPGWHKPGHCYHRGPRWCQRPARDRKLLLWLACCLSAEYRRRSVPISKGCSGTLARNVWCALSCLFVSLCVFTSPYFWKYL